MGLFSRSKEKKPSSETAREDPNEVVHAASGSTRLHMACSHGDLDGVRRLLAAGADVNVVNGNGATPLDLTYSNAAQGGPNHAVYVQIAALLRGKGGVAQKWHGTTC